jgi:hypothetical protein
MTKSSVKAISGSVRVLLHGQEFWVKPEDVKLGDITLGELVAELKSLQATVYELSKAVIENAATMREQVSRIDTLLNQNKELTLGLQEALINEVKKKVVVGL